MSIPAHWDGTQSAVLPSVSSRYGPTLTSVADADGANQPIYESCARQLKARFEGEDRSVQSLVKKRCYAGGGGYLQEGVFELSFKPTTILWKLDVAIEVKLVPIREPRELQDVVCAVFANHNL